MASICNISAVCEYPCYPVAGPDTGSVEVSALVEVKTPSPSAPRPVFELALLLDISGSMSGARLESLKNAVLTLLDHLDSRDVVHLITYAGSPTVVGSGMIVGSERETLKRAVANLHAAGSTNISDALEKAAHCIQRGGRDLLRRIFLYSDGEPTSGLMKPHEFAALCRDLKASSGAEVSTFGIGEGIDAGVLQTIAEVSCGRYEFVTQKRIVELTERAFTSMDRLFAVKGELHLKAPPGILLRSAEEETTPSTGSGILHLSLGNLKYDAPKQYLLQLAVAPGCAGGNVVVELSYVPALDPLGSTRTQDAVLNVSLLPPKEAFAGARPRDARVALALALKSVGEAFTRASAALEARDTSKAQSIITEAMAELQQFKDLDETGMAETQLRRGQRLLDRLRVQGQAGARRVELELGHQAAMLQRCLSVDDFSSSCSDNHSALGSPTSPPLSPDSSAPASPNSLPRSPRAGRHFACLQSCDSGSSSPESPATPIEEGFDSLVPTHHGPRAEPRCGIVALDDHTEPLPVAKRRRASSMCRSDSDE